MVEAADWELVECGQLKQQRAGRYRSAKCRGPSALRFSLLNTLASRIRISSGVAVDSQRASGGDSDSGEASSLSDNNNSPSPLRNLLPKSKRARPGGSQVKAKEVVSGTQGSEEEEETVEGAAGMAGPPVRETEVVPPLPPRYRFRDLIMGDFAFNDDGER